MNIFYLSRDPAKASKYHCDKHVVKMILESAQMLSTAHRILDGDSCDKSLYKATHKNHPSTVWVRSNSYNYQWLYSLLCNLCSEYTFRYKKTHATQRLLKPLKSCPNNIPKNKTWVEPPQCMPDEYKCTDTVEGYRKYYIGEKMRFAKWAYSDTPEWVNR
jgi:hypothetical protein|tara:strand:+ start:1885 stop:2364 length:480 start_codon:yes stop_codon:yes gene_type:complete